MTAIENVGNLSRSTIKPLRKMAKAVNTQEAPSQPRFLVEEPSLPENQAAPQRPDEKQGGEAGFNEQNIRSRYGSG
ncbi:MAG: hypothetical protein ACRCTY_07115, partial [Candidatus Adiutrix sp.]